MCTIHIIYIQSQCILAMWRCFVIMEEGGGTGDGWSNLCHGFEFVCQERILKTLPGPG